MKSITKLLATSCLATMLAGTAHAQVVPAAALPDTNTTTADKEDDAIVVTGTRSDGRTPRQSRRSSR